MKLWHDDFYGYPEYDDPHFDEFDKARFDTPLSAKQVVDSVVDFVMMLYSTFKARRH